jgi:hypothetical protein
MHEFEQLDIIKDCHNSPYGGHHVGDCTTAKVLQYGFHMPTLFKDCANYVKTCDKCQLVGNIGKRNEMLTNYSMPLKPLDVWGFDFMGSFPSSTTKHTHFWLQWTMLQSGWKQFQQKVQIMLQQ